MPKKLTKLNYIKGCVECELPKTQHVSITISIAPIELSQAIVACLSKVSYIRRTIKHIPTKEEEAPALPAIEIKFSATIRINKKGKFVFAF